MKLTKIFSFGKIYNNGVYANLKVLDEQVFDADDEFKTNREWWVILDDNKIVAYCGSGYMENICHFVRAWVSPKYRGKGLQRKMIKTRLKAAKDYEVAITYTSIDNVVSSNNLISTGFKLYQPKYKWAGKQFNYWIKFVK